MQTKDVQGSEKMSHKGWFMLHYRYGEKDEDQPNHTPRGDLREGVHDRPDLRATVDRPPGVLLRALMAHRGRVRGQRRKRHEGQAPGAGSPYGSRPQAQHRRHRGVEDG